MKHIVLQKKVYIECFVESEKSKTIKYKVVFNKDGWYCACKNYQIKKEPCKHIKYVKQEEKI